jgi:hypothetical protein
MPLGTHTVNSYSCKGGVKIYPAIIRAAVHTVCMYACCPASAHVRHDVRWLTQVSVSFMYRPIPVTIE